MRKKSNLAVALFILVTGLYGAATAAQSQLMPRDQISNGDSLFPLRKTPVYFEVNLLLNPVYVIQASSKFRLNGHRLPFPKAYRPKFYSTQPWQNAFSSIGEIADQANSLYGSFYLAFLERSKTTFLHNIRLVVGATHEKMEADSPAVVDYRYKDGGTEATVMLEKNIAYKLSNRQYKETGIIFGVNAQAGFFESVAKARTIINYDGYHMYSTDTNQRWQWPSPRNGWGWVAGLNMEVGGLVCHDFFISNDFSRNCWLGKGLFWFFRRFGVSVASKIAIDGLYSADGVIVNGVPANGVIAKATGNRLRGDNYSLFFAGPLINVKWISLK
jgi:hypothetical protein